LVSDGGFDFCDVNLLHLHHGREGAWGDAATFGEGDGQSARG